MTSFSTLDLAGQWQLVDDTGAYAIAMQIPGDAITALHEAGRIPEPYWGQNEYDLRWISERDWTLSRTFTLTDTHCVLHVSELDTVATIRINGQIVLQAANAFRRHRVDVSHALRSGDNTIDIAFRSSIEAANEAQEQQPFFVPYHFINNPLYNGNMLRKQQCDFGWDWNIALAPFGLYGAIILEPKTVHRIDRVTLSQTHSNNAVDVNVTVHIDSQEAGEVAWRLSAFGQDETGLMQARPGSNAVTTTFHVENPQLWWPAGLGEQPLHDVMIEVADQRETRRIGLRDMQQVNTVDEAGIGFKFTVNGHDVFVRGANWIPADALTGRIDPAHVRELLESAVAANMNMIRVWGGGRYEPDWFYDLCDELGLMVWQDFMFACNLYPATDDFLTEVSAEVRDVVSRLHHHACLALWCGDNELIGALNWFEESLKDRDRYLVAYDRLNRAIEAALKQTDPTANWWPSSPSPGVLSFGDAWHDDSSGDMHFWSVWHEGKDFEHYRDVAPRFCSEFGFQSYPSMPVVRTFAEKDDFNIASPVMESHQKNKSGNARIAETMFRYFRFPIDFESFVYLSQVQQGLAIKTAVTHWRSVKPHCMGTLYWQLNDTWPVCSWASLNYGGSWKLLHYMACHFYSPLMATLVPTHEGYAVKAVNDTGDDQTFCPDLLSVRPDGSCHRPDNRFDGKAAYPVGPDAATTLGVLHADQLDDDAILLLRWRDAANTVRTDLLSRKPFKHYPLQPSQLSITTTQDGADTVLTLTSKAAAFFVGLEADVPGRFSDNAVHVLPDYPVVLRFTPHKANARPTFSWHDLYTATYTSSRTPTDEITP